MALFHIMATHEKSLNFLEQIIEDDLKSGYSANELRFRFPPEPNGYLHIGHASSIALNFGLGQRYNAPVNLRFDDTNPEKEEQEYVDAIRRDVTWLGYEWAEERYASDYFQQLFDWAVLLIEKGKAYVDSQSSEEIAAQKGTPTQPGTASPYRDRSVKENMDLFLRMKAGEFAEGTHILRAKIDMSSPNMLMRDPIMYRIMHKTHHRTKDDWCIYPMYDWAHGQSDYIEQISHSLCTLEFLPHRELYDWFLDQIGTQGIRPKQREFARRNLSHTVVSKRKLLQLVNEKHVSGWDDPRMSTISGLRRRGYTPASLRQFAQTIGVAKRENLIDVSLLEFCIREDLNKTAPRVMAVIDPVRVVISNYPEGKTEWLEAENNQEDLSEGFRKIPFGREIYIERDDFMEQATGKFFRLSIGHEVRLKNAYIVKADSVEKDEKGEIQTIFVRYDPDSLSGSGTEASQRKVAATLHWVDKNAALPAEVRLYDRLFLDEAPDAHKDRDFKEFLNPDSLKIVQAFVEPGLASAKVEDKFQFQRVGYFTVDKDSTREKLVFNRTVGLRDAWAEQGKKEENAINNSLKEINRYFKAQTQTDRDPIEANIANALKSLTNYSLVQNAFKKNVSNNKSSLLFSIWLAKNSSLIDVAKLDAEIFDKWVSMSFRSESVYVRREMLQLLKANNKLQAVSELVAQLKEKEKDETILELL